MTTLDIFLAAHAPELAGVGLFLAAVGMYLPGLIVRLGKDER